VECPILISSQISAPDAIHGGDPTRDGTITSAYRTFSFNARRRSESRARTRSPQSKIAPRARERRSQKNRGSNFACRIVRSVGIARLVLGRIAVGVWDVWRSATRSGIGCRQSRSGCRHGVRGMGRGIAWPPPLWRSRRRPSQPPPLLLAKLNACRSRRQRATRLWNWQRHYSNDRIRSESSGGRYPSTTTSRARGIPGSLLAPHLAPFGASFPANRPPHPARFPRVDYDHGWTAAAVRSDCSLSPPAFRLFFEDMFTQLAHHPI